MIYDYDGNPINKPDKFVVGKDILLNRGGAIEFNQSIAGTQNFCLKDSLQFPPSMKDKMLSQGREDFVVVICTKKSMEIATAE